MRLKAFFHSRPLFCLSLGVALGLTACSKNTKQETAPGAQPQVETFKQDLLGDEANQGRLGIGTFGQAPQYQWGSFRGGPSNPGLSALAVRGLFQTFSNRPVTEFDTGGLVWATPVIDEAGNIYVGAANKYFFSFSSDGKKRWEYRIDDKADSLIDSAAALAPGIPPGPALIVVPGGDGALHALNRNTGELVWKYEAHGATDASHQSGVVVNSFEGNVQYGGDKLGLIYAGSDNGTMYAIDQSGHEVWQRKTGMMIWTAALISPSAKWMAFGSLDGHLYFVDPKTGSDLADPYELKADVKSTPTTDGKGNIFFGNSSGELVSLGIYQSDSGYSLEENWRYKTPREVYSSPTVVDGKVLFGSAEGTFYALDSEKGTVLWTYTAYSQILSSPIVTRDKVVLFGAKNGKLYALNLDTGARLWSYRATLDSIKSNLDSSPALDANGIIHLGSYNGNIYNIPYEYCPTHKMDTTRCEFGGQKDLPNFDFPRNQQELATLVWIPSQTNRLFDSSSALQMRLIVYQDGEFLPNAAIDAGQGKLKVDITPHADVRVQVSSDGKYLNIYPQGYLTPGQDYKVAISGQYYLESTNYIVDRINPANWIGTSFSAEETFKVKRTVSQPLKGMSAENSLTWGLKSMYLLQPEALDTYTPAALDGQGFLVTAFGFNPTQQKMLMLAIPATPKQERDREDFTLIPEPSKVFTLEGSYQGDNLKGTGSFDLAAMGGEMPLKPFNFSAVSNPKTGNLEGQMNARTWCLGIKGNGTAYSFPFSLANQLCDPFGYLNSVGLFKGIRMPQTEPQANLSHFKVHGNQIEVTLANPQFPTEHLLTVVQYDPNTLTVVSRSTEVVKPNTDTRRKALTWV